MRDQQAAMRRAQALQVQSRWDASQQLDTTEKIVTPENIAFEHQCAGPVTRLLAFVIDFLVFVMIMSVLFLIEALLGMLLAWALAATNLTFLLDELFYLVVGVNLFLVFLAYWLAWGWMETRFNGQTLGKMVINIRTVTASGHPISGGQAMTRSIIRAVELMPVLTTGFLSGLVTPPRVMAKMLENGEFDLTTGIPLGTGLVGLLFLIFLPRFQRLGDLVAGTMVVYEHRHPNPGLAELEDPRTASLAELIPASFRPRREMVKAISAYVHRRPKLSESRRIELASQLAQPLMSMFGMMPDTNPDLLLCAIYHRQLIAPDTFEKRQSLEAQRRTTQEPAGVVG